MTALNLDDHDAPAMHERTVPRLSVVDDGPGCIRGAERGDEGGPSDGGAHHESDLPQLSGRAAPSPGAMPERAVYSEPATRVAPGDVMDAVSDCVTAGIALEDEVRADRSTHAALERYLEKWNRVLGMVYSRRVGW